MNWKKKILIVLLNITKILLFLVFANFIINSYNPTEEQLSSAKRNKDTLNLKEKDIDDPEDLIRNVSNIGHHGVGDYEFVIKSEDDFYYFNKLFEQSYDEKI